MITESEFTKNWGIEILNPLNIATSTVNLLIDLTKKSFGTELSVEDIQEHILEVDLLLLLWRGSKIKGFTSVKFFKMNFLKIYHVNMNLLP